MTRTSLARYPCPLARAAETVGDKWSLLILRDALAGVRRFSDFKTRLGVSTNILTERLNTLVEAGVLSRQPTRPGVSRVDYALTDKGLDLAPALIALWQWGERWAFEPGQSPVTVRTRDTHEALAPVQIQTKSGAAVRLVDLEMAATDAAPTITQDSYAALKARQTGKS
jgi:DNA-binding HxlR family transcriptional regulator